jgi:DNA (cytosine-5)-methyltransferase 1
MKTNIFSFFSGAGFLDLGFEKEGFTVSFVNEKHKPFLDAYKFSRKNLRIRQPEFGYFNNSIEDFISGELRKKLNEQIVETKNKGEIVGFIGGPPCPDFSVGGKNKGKDGNNGRLSEIYTNLILDQEPDFFLFENVKGLWKTAKHREFYENLKTSLRTKYKLTERLTNAIEYGSPQDRERIILLGFRESVLSLETTTFIDESPDTDFFSWLKFSDYPDRSAFDFDWVETNPFEENGIIEKPKNTPVELTIEHWFKQNDVENHANAQHFFQPRAGLPRFLTILEGDSSRKSYKRLHRWRYSPTAAYGNNEVHLHPYKARRISASEALAIQSLPKNFVLPSEMTLSNMFKAIGNGVPFLAGKMLARTIKDFLEENNATSHSIGHYQGY